jgi:hypothetical protein
MTSLSVSESLHGNHSGNWNVSDSSSQAFPCVVDDGSGHSRFQQLRETDLTPDSILIESSTRSDELPVEYRDRSLIHRKQYTPTTDRVPQEADTSAFFNQELSETVNRDINWNPSFQKNEVIESGASASSIDPRLTDDTELPVTFLTTPFWNAPQESLPVLVNLAQPSQEPLHTTNQSTPPTVLSEEFMRNYSGLGGDVEGEVSALHRSLCARSSQVSLKRYLPCHKSSLV